MRKILFATILVLAAATSVLFAACDFGGGGKEKTPQTPVSYGFAKVNYHYDYTSFIETYWQESYTIQTGNEYKILEFYTPPVNYGYRFLGWTMESGGSGTLCGTPFTIVGSGGSGTIYNLYAKYEAIEYNVIYHLNGGTNNPDNPDTLTGRKTLKNPTKTKYWFSGWYSDPEFGSNNVVTELRILNNYDWDGNTTIHLYAKWTEIYNIEYVSNINLGAGNTLEGDKASKTYREDSSDFMIHLTQEYFTGYLFLGWTWEGQSIPILEIDKMSVLIPRGSTGDLVFTANYRRASLPIDIPGLEVLHDGINRHATIITVPEGVTEIIVADISSRTLKYGGGYNYSIIGDVVIRHKGERPTVITREGVNVTFELI